MKAKGTINLGVALFWCLLLLPISASAFCNPTAGRWIARDPLGDLSFLLSSIAKAPSGEFEQLVNASLFEGYAAFLNNPIQFLDKLGLENVSVTATTAIRPPDAQAGVKTVHTVTINEFGQIVGTPFTFTGATVVFGVSITGTSTFRQWVTGTHPNFTVTMIVSSHSATLPSGYDIDYNFDVQLNFCQHTGNLSGVHDQYPSYTVSVGAQIYDFRQRGTFLNLWGPGNISPNVDFNW